MACVVDPEVNGHWHGPEKPVVFRAPSQAFVVGKDHLTTALPTTHVAVMLDNSRTT
jgi:hypothetical protein